MSKKVAAASGMAFSEVEHVVASTDTVTCQGETFTLKAFGVRKLQKALPHIAVIGLLLQALDGQAEGDASTMIGLVAHGGDALLELLAIATDKPAAWFDDADPFEVAALALAVTQVNLDFFVSARSKLEPLKAHASALVSKLKSAK